MITVHSVLSTSIMAINSSFDVRVKIGCDVYFKIYWHVSCKGDENRSKESSHLKITAKKKNKSPLAVSYFEWSKLWKNKLVSFTNLNKNTNVYISC